MTRRPIAALVITALLGAQPGTAALAGEIAKSLPAAPNPGASAVPSALPRVDLDLSPSIRSVQGLPATAVPGLGSLGPAAPAQTRGPEAPVSSGLGRLVLIPAQAMRAVGERLRPAQAAARGDSARAPLGGLSGRDRERAGSSIWRGLGRLASVFAPEDAAKTRDAEGEDALRGFFDGDDTRVFLTEHGRDPAAAALSGLSGALAADPRYAAALAKSGRVRIVVASQGGTLTPARAAEIESSLRATGVSPRVNTEKILVRAPKSASDARADWTSPSKDEPAWKRVLLAAPRELSYISRTFKASITRPTWPEVVGGLVSKGPAFGMSVAWYAKLMLPIGATAPFAAAIVFSLALETFHGIFINTWQNLQNAIGRQRGVTYQTFFNLAYMQLTSAIARIITWTAIPSTIAPWHWQYWRDMGIVTFVGTFIGTLGFQGLNDLYNKGVIGRNTRSAIQQGRDLFFLLAGVFFASGSMGIFWPLFIAQQTIDLALFAYSHFAKARPIAYVADARTAESPEFMSMYPVTPGPRPSPMRQALDALTGNPLARLLAWPLRKGWELLKGGRK